MAKAKEEVNPELKKAFEKINLEPKVIDNTLANAKVTEALLSTIKEANLTECDKKVGNLLYNVATKATGSIESKRALLARYVGEGKIATSQQLDLALAFLRKNSNQAEISTNEFEKACGVGVVTTDKDVEKVAHELIEKDKSDIVAKRYTINFGEYLKKIKDKLPFADGAVVMKIFNGAIEALLGPKNADDLKPKAKVTKPKETAAPEETKKEEAEEEEDDLKKEKLSKLVARDLAQTLNTPELLEKHNAFSGGKVITRFPPEPNGYLHIGHAKAIRFNFMTAAEYGGLTYLRFDDTNPDKETVEFIEKIKENVAWLGYKPWKITYSSENFNKLYDFAVYLIKKDKAYVDQQTPDEVHEFRRNKLPSPYRNRPIEESLKMFEGMRNGLYEEGEVCLRLKIDPANDNPTLRDPIAYRIKYTPHPHAGSEWCIYPTYDFTHCICDSLENITHSLCTLEFEIRRDLYYWILEQLDLYRPYVYEFSRLNISNTVLSKRRLTELVTKNVKGWDDPRIMTLNGLRRRGYTPEAINEFCDLVSVTRRGNENIISIQLLEHCIRKDLEVRAKRVFAVLDPVKVIIENVDDKYAHTATAVHFPREPAKGGYPITLHKEFYVDRSDVRLEDSKDFFGFAPNKLVGLKYAFPVRVKQILTGDKGEITEMRVDLEQDSATKPKTFLNWISVKESLPAIVNLYDVLFNSYNPSEDADWRSSINPNSLIMKTNAKVHKSVAGSKIEDKYQFERIGYFNIDNDSNPEKGLYIFNKTVGLVDKGKQKALNTK